MATNKGGLKKNTAIAKKAEKKKENYLTEDETNELRVSYIQITLTNRKSLIYLMMINPEQLMPKRSRKFLKTSVWTKETLLFTLWFKISKSKSNKIYYFS
jgi:hypothetical protein